MPGEIQWTHPSVVSLSTGSDPVDVIARNARKLVFEAIECGWTGPPFDPVALAELRGIELEARADVLDTRLVPTATGKFTIEFNPNRPRNRIRFSVAHEIAHTLFPDAAQQIRYRNRTGRLETAHWQLEVLCDVAAAEILMPIGEGAELQRTPVEIDALIERGHEYEVSMEAVLLRVLKLTSESCAVFAAARIEEPAEERPTFRIDYCLGSEAWRRHPRLSGRRIQSTALSKCTAVGYTAKGFERWRPAGPELRVEAVGVPPFPGASYPRIVGVLLDDAERAPIGEMVYLIGDATKPQTDRPAVIAHIVNDRTPNWGAGFGRSLAKQWPAAQEGFRRWALSNKDHLQLGHSRATKLRDELYAFHMVAQRGYKPRRRPLIRYEAVETCLVRLAKFAKEQSAEVHMPRIGTGYAGGNWPVIQDLIRQHLTATGVPVMVYELPGKLRPRQQEAPESTQLALSLGG